MAVSLKKKGSGPKLAWDAEDRKSDGEGRSADLGADRIVTYNINNTYVLTQSDPIL